MDFSRDKIRLTDRSSVHDGYFNSNLHITPVQSFVNCFWLFAWVSCFLFFCFFLPSAVRSTSGSLDLFQTVTPPVCLSPGEAYSVSGGNRSGEWPQWWGMGPPGEGLTSIPQHRCHHQHDSELRWAAIQAVFMFQSLMRWQSHSTRDDCQSTRPPLDGRNHTAVWPNLPAEPHGSRCPFSSVSSSFLILSLRQKSNR